MRKRTRDENDAQRYEMVLQHVQREAAAPEGFVPVLQQTTRGPIAMRLYAAADVTRGAIFVGGAGGGFDTPVKGWLYPRLCNELQSGGIAGLRVQYRQPNELGECVLDVLAGIGFLQSEGIESLAVVGHSFGGAVVIQAAALSPAVQTCVALSTQTYGADAADELGPRCSLLLAHGLADEVLPADCSRWTYQRAKEPKRLLLKEHVRHGLDEWSEELPGIVRDWIKTQLAGAPAAQG